MRLPVSRVAVVAPATVETATVPIGFVWKSEKVTVPLGSTDAVAEGVTLAVSVTFWP